MRFSAKLNNTFASPMFRFSRRIRQKLFVEGRVSRYFGYAIGEIVVGILIALQISNWNQARADATLEQRYIERLIANVEKDKGMVDAPNDPEIARKRPVEFLVAVRQSGQSSRPPLFSDTFEE